MTHPCPITNCHAHLPSDQFMCVEHLNLVPREQMQEVYRYAGLVKHARGANQLQAAVRKLRQARQRAIQAVMDGVGGRREMA